MSKDNDLPPPAKPTAVRMTLWALLFAVMMLLFAIITIATISLPAPRSVEEAMAARRKAQAGNQKDKDLQRLNSYGWVDEKGKKAHMPIDAAMKQYAEAPAVAPAANPDKK